MKTLPDGKPGDSPSHRNVSLVLKDNIREVRLNAKVGAKRWIENFEEVFAELPAPLGRPFGFAARVGTRMLDIADKTAVSLLTDDGDYRKGDFRLTHPSAWTDMLESSTHHHAKALYWGLKELLKIKNQTDFMVLEEGVYRACCNFNTVVAQVETSTESNIPIASASSMKSALLIKSLYEARPITYRRPLTIEESEIIEKVATLNVFACVGVVVAAEITELFPKGSSYEETHDALLLADEVTAARLHKFDVALHENSPTVWIAKELDFLVRHI